MCEGRGERTFRAEPLARNMPVLMALAGVWYAISTAPRRRQSPYDIDSSASGFLQQPQWRVTGSAHAHAELVEYANCPGCGAPGPRAMRFSELTGPPLVRQRFIACRKPHPAYAAHTRFSSPTLCANEALCAARARRSRVNEARVASGEIAGWSCTRCSRQNRRRRNFCSMR